MIDSNLIITYYGNPPYYRNLSNGLVEKLPNRIRLPDGSTRTDPSQWAADPIILELAGYETTTINQADIDRKIPPPPSFEDLKRAKLAELDQRWQQIIKQGWETPYGWSLGLDFSDVTLLTGAFLLLKEANSLGLQNSTSIIDTDGTSHEINLSDLTSLMLAYGQYRSQLSQEDALIRTQIKSATTPEELDEVNYGST